jgi:hypothetical protein
VTEDETKKRRVVERFHYSDSDHFGTTLVFEYEADGSWVNFEAHEVVGFTESPTVKGSYDVPRYEKFNYTGSGDETNNLDDACPQVHGMIKWDGCSHVYFGNPKGKGEGTDGYLHLCGEGSWLWLQHVLARVWLRCREILIETGKWYPA